jgi:hypothetical protein
MSRKDSHQKKPEDVIIDLYLNLKIRKQEEVKYLN